MFPISTQFLFRVLISFHVWLNFFGGLLNWFWSYHWIPSAWPKQTTGSSGDDIYADLMLFNWAIKNYNSQYSWSHWIGIGLECRWNEKTWFNLGESSKFRGHVVFCRPYVLREITWWKYYPNLSDKGLQLGTLSGEQKNYLFLNKFSENKWKQNVLLKICFFWKMFHLKTKDRIYSFDIKTHLFMKQLLLSPGCKGRIHQSDWIFPLVFPNSCIQIIHDSHVSWALDNFRHV